MNTYVISDIHGCYEEFLAMLDKIGFSSKDRLILAGDYVDRGRDSLKMLRWLEKRPDNVWSVRGNHDEEFAVSIKLMRELDWKEGLDSDPDSSRDALALYRSLQYYCKKQGLSAGCFDCYGTMEGFLRDQGVTLRELYRWLDMFWEMPLYYELKAEGRDCVVVHGGYVEKPEELGERYSDRESFYLQAREEGYLLGGKEHGLIVAGHTPTIIPGTFTYTGGSVFRYYNAEKDCVFYDIDCGCAFRDQDPRGRLACIRLEDERIYYV